MFIRFSNATPLAALLFATLLRAAESPTIDTRGGPSAVPNVPVPQITLEGYSDNQGGIILGVFTLRNPTKHSIWYRGNGRYLPQFRRERWSISDGQWHDESAYQCTNGLSDIRLSPGQSVTFEAALYGSRYIAEDFERDPTGESRSARIGIFYGLTRQRIDIPLWSDRAERPSTSGE